MDLYHNIPISTKYNPQITITNIILLANSYNKEGYFGKQFVYCFGCYKTYINQNIIQDKLV